MSADPAVSVIIPTWNGRSLLDVCLPSPEKQSRRDFEVIVVDNGSIDALDLAGLVHCDLRPANLLLREADHESALVLMVLPGSA